MLISHRNMKLQRVFYRWREWPTRIIAAQRRHIPLWQRLLRNQRVIYERSAPRQHRRACEYF